MEILTICVTCKRKKGGDEWKAGTTHSSPLSQGCTELLRHFITLRRQTGLWCSLITPVLSDCTVTDLINGFHLVAAYSEWVIMTERKRDIHNYTTFTETGHWQRRIPSNS
jgi:hypothetical protein